MHRFSTSNDIYVQLSLSMTNRHLQQWHIYCLNLLKSSEIRRLLGGFSLFVLPESVDMFIDVHDFPLLHPWTLDSRVKLFICFILQHYRHTGYVCILFIAILTLSCYNIYSLNVLSTYSCTCINHTVFTPALIRQKGILFLRLVKYSPRPFSKQTISVFSTFLTNVAHLLKTLSQFVKDETVLTALSPFMYSVCTICLFTESNSVQSMWKFGSEPFRITTPFFKPQRPPGSLALCQRRSRLQRIPSDRLGRLRCGITLLKRIIPPLFTGNALLSRPKSTPVESKNNFLWQHETAYTCNYTSIASH